MANLLDFEAWPDVNAELGGVGDDPCAAPESEGIDNPEVEGR